MKWAMTSLLLAIGVSSGCITFPTGKEQPKPPVPLVGTQPPGPDHPIVKPDQVSDANAREKASELAEELEAERAPTK